MSHIVLVTGGTSGIGQAVAEYLSARGMTVYAAGRTCQTAHAESGPHFLQMDVTKEQSVSEALEQIKKKHGQLDAVINNAGLGLIGPVEAVSDAEAREIFDTNVFGLLNVCRHSIPLLRVRSGSHIINVTSIGGRVGLPFRGIYCSSKFAVEGLTESLRMELRRFNIMVSIIEPGDFKTNINANRRYPKIPLSDLYPEYGEVKGQVDNEVAKANDPVVMGQKVYQIITSTNPKLRYRAAPFFQGLSIEIKKIVPDRWFERLIMNHYKMKRRQ